MVFEVRDLWPQGAVELKKIRNPLFIKAAFIFEKVCYTNSDIVVVASQGMYESINNRYASIQTLIIPNASDIVLFSSSHNEIVKSTGNEGLKYFVYTGSIGLIDDLEQCIDAMSIVRRNDIRLIIIGDGAERKYLEEKVKIQNINNVEFLGLKPKSELVQWYSKAWASILTVTDTPVIQACSPNKMFDSFAAGVPIIQNSTGWIKTLVETENCGINIEQHNPKNFADAISFICDHPDKRNYYAQNALRLAQTEFNRDNLAEKYINAIEAL